MSPTIPRAMTTDTFWLDKLAAKLTFGPVPVHPEYLDPVLTPGMVLRSAHEIILVGDVNDLWGVCNDCTFDREFMKGGHLGWQAAHLSQLNNESPTETTPTQET